MAKEFCVANWSEFQNYKDRSPPWIRLYNDLLDKYEYGLLSDAGKGHLVAIWLLASRRKNRLPWDPEWIGRRIQAKSKVNLQELETLGFIQILDDGSNLLAPCKQEATQSRAEESREEQRDIVELGPKKAGKEIVQEVFVYWQQTHGNPKAILSEERSKKIRERLAEGYTVERIKGAIRGIKLSPHHMGKNDRNTPYLDIVHVCKNGKNVDTFAGLDEKAGARTAPRAKVMIEPEITDEQRQQNVERAREFLAGIGGAS